MNCKTTLIGCFFVYLLASGSPLIACPVCFGKVHKGSPPFFTKEFYTNPEHKKFLTNDHYTLQPNAQKKKEN